jgi:ankyrin repeat protein
LKLLLGQGADAGALNKKGKTALDLCIQAGDEWHHLSRQLLQRGAFACPAHAVYLVFVSSLFLLSLSSFLLPPFRICFTFVFTSVSTFLAPS